MESELQPVFDEDRQLDGAPRSLYDPLLEALEGLDLIALQESVAEGLRDRGVTFGSCPFVVDPVPRLITGAEWRRIEAGLVQRTRALNRFLIDAYGPQRAVAEGILSRGTVEDAEGFEAELVGRLPPQRWPAAIIGFDLVRDLAGEFLILEDNVRTPSGYAYALAAREALQEALQGALPREGWPVPRPVDPATFELLAGVMRAAGRPGAPPGSVAVLTDGPDNVAYYEHARAAERLGAILATPDQLDVVGERLGVRLSDGSVEPVGVVYRRTDEDRAYDERGELTDVAAVLLPAWLAGNLGLVNAFGNGLADDKLVHGHVEDFIRFYLEEEPLLRSVPTSHVASEPEVTIARARGHHRQPRPARRKAAPWPRRQGGGHRSACAGGGSGAPGAGAGAPSRGLHQPAVDHPVPASDGDRRAASAAARGSAPVRLRRSPGVADAGRPPAGSPSIPARWW